MSGSWSFVLTDATGAALAELATASGRTIAFKRNSYAEAQLSISHEDDAAALLFSALATGIPKLRAYRRGPADSSAVLRFRGYLAALSEVSEETSMVTATFRSPFGVLLGDGDKVGRFLLSAQTYAATDAGLIAKALIDTANAVGTTGLATSSGLIAATKTRDRTYPLGQNIGAAVQDLTNVLDGFDFYETFVDGTGATDANFNVVASVGSTQPAVHFEYGPGTLANILHMERTTLPPVNSMLTTGANGLQSTYADVASVAKYGSWWGHQDFSTVSEQATLDDKAKALVRVNPIKTVTFIPELGLANCPQPFDDWNLGDTVSFRASRGALSENVQLRINGFTIPIDENGVETVTVQDPTSPEDDAIIAAALLTEVVSS